MNINSINVHGSPTISPEGKLSLYLMQVIPETRRAH
jgi:hypothetical protein